MLTGGLALPCIVCDKPLRQSVPEDRTNNPNHGVCFGSHGNYGSTVADMEEGVVEISVCDACLVAKARAGAVGYVTQGARPLDDSMAPFNVSWWKEKDTDEHERDS